MADSVLAQIVDLTLIKDVSRELKAGEPGYRYDPEKFLAYPQQANVVEAYARAEDISIERAIRSYCQPSMYEKMKSLIERQELNRIERNIDTLLGQTEHKEAIIKLLNPPKRRTKKERDELAQELGPQNIFITDRQYFLFKGAIRHHGTTIILNDYGSIDTRLCGGMIELEENKIIIRYNTVKAKQAYIDELNAIGFEPKNRMKNIAVKRYHDLVPRISAEGYRKLLAEIIIMHEKGHARVFNGLKRNNRIEGFDKEDYSLEHDLMRRTPEMIILNEFLAECMVLENIMSLDRNASRDYLEVYRTQFLFSMADESEHPVSNESTSAILSFLDGADNIEDLKIKRNNILKRFL